MGYRFLSLADLVNAYDVGNVGATRPTVAVGHFQHPAATDRCHHR
jgi:hypothetical protein